MLRSRMLTPGFRLFFGMFSLLFTSALIFGMSSSLQLEGSTVGDRLQKEGIVKTVLGPMSMGWKGAVGNHLGYGLLLGAAAIAAFVAIVLVAFRDADAEAGSQLLQIETVPLTRAPAGANFAPLVAAFAVAMMALGWVINTTLFYAGATLVVITMVTWTVRAWSERATGDDEVNRQIYARIIDPLRVPVVGLLCIGFVVVGLSQLLLAVPSENWSRVLFAVAALLFFAGVMAVYSRPQLARPLSTALLVVGAVLILAGGIYGIAKGVRPIEPHGPGGSHGEPAGGH